MTTKVRIYELAKQENMSSKELIELINKEFGITAKNHMSVIEGEEANIIMEFVEDMKKGKKRGSTAEVINEASAEAVEEKKEPEEEPSEGNVCCLCVVYSLYGLRHYSIICCNYQYSYISCLCTSGSHCSKGFMSRSI